MQILQKWCFANSKNFVLKITFAVEKFEKPWKKSSQKWPFFSDKGPRFFKNQDKSGNFPSSRVNEGVKHTEEEKSVLDKVLDDKQLQDPASNLLTNNSQVQGQTLAQIQQNQDTEMPVPGETTNKSFNKSQVDQNKSLNKSQIDQNKSQIDQNKSLNKSVLDQSVNVGDKSLERTNESINQSALILKGGKFLLEWKLLKKCRFSLEKKFSMWKIRNYHKMGRENFVKSLVTTLGEGRKNLWFGCKENCHL